MNSFVTASAVFGILTFLLGACVGSFLNVCIARWPAGESVVKPRSRCPKCSSPIAWYDNLPILAWLLLRGRCRACHALISAEYPIVEAAIGALWFASFWVFGPGFLAIRVAVFATVLAGIAITDLKHYLIPDGFTIFGLFFAGLTSIAGAFVGQQTPFASPADALFGACVGAGAITIIGWLGEAALKKEAMGFGDTTLMAMVGAALGPGRTLLTVFVGALIAAVIFVAIVYPVGWIRSNKTGIPFEPPLVPFGVFLAPAALLVLFWGFPLIGWYLDRASL